MVTTDTERDESDGELKAERSRAVQFLKSHTRDGSIPLVAGATVFLGALRSSGGRANKAGRVIAAAALIGIGIRQRRHHKSTGESSPIATGAHGGTGTYEQRADSHRGDENPRGTATDPEVGRERDSQSSSINFTEQQEESKSNPDLDNSSASDSRVHEDEPTVDLSEASLADEASEAAGPSSVQSQPTQTDSIEPEETPPEDSQSGDAEEQEE